MRPPRQGTIYAGLAIAAATTIATTYIADPCQTTISKVTAADMLVSQTPEGGFVLLNSAADGWNSILGHLQITESSRVDPTFSGLFDPVVQTHFASASLNIRTPLTQDQTANLNAAVEDELRRRYSSPVVNGMATVRVEFLRCGIIINSIRAAAVLAVLVFGVLWTIKRGR